MRTLMIFLSALIMISSAGCASLNTINKKGDSKYKKEQKYSGKQEKKDSKKSSKKNNKKSYY